MIDLLQLFRSLRNRSAKRNWNDWGSETTGLWSRATDSWTSFLFASLPVQDSVWLVTGHRAPLRTYNVRWGCVLQLIMLGDFALPKFQTSIQQVIQTVSPLLRKRTRHGISIVELIQNSSTQVLTEDLAIRRRAVYSGSTGPTHLPLRWTTPPRSGGNRLHYLREEGSLHTRIAWTFSSCDVYDVRCAQLMTLTTSQFHRIVCGTPAPST